MYHLSISYSSKIALNLSLFVIYSSLKQNTSNGFLFFISVLNYWELRFTIIKWLLQGETVMNLSGFTGGLSYPSAVLWIF